MLRFALKVENAQKIDFALSGLASSVKDFRRVWPRVVDYIGLKVEQQQFATFGGRGPAGTWSPYKRTHKGKSGAIKREGQTASLRDTNALYESLTGHTEHTIERFAPLSMAFGTDAPGFQWQTMKRYPARRIFDFQPEDNRLIASFITAATRDAARRLGFRIAALGNERVGGAEALQIGATRLTEGGSLSDYL